MTSPVTGADSAIDLPNYVPVPRFAMGVALNDQGYYVGRLERNLYWVTNGVYQAALLPTRAGVVLFDAPPTIGGNLRRAVDEIATANGVTNPPPEVTFADRYTLVVGGERAAPATAATTRTSRRRSAGAVRWSRVAEDVVVTDDIGLIPHAGPTIALSLLKSRHHILVIRAPTSGASVSGIKESR